jgi:pimeloyl-ACP methyl ester carboxylesterase
MPNFLNRMMGRRRTPTLAPPPFADRWWHVDGLRLHARDYGGGEGEAKLPVVCLHGLTRNARDFEELAPWIAARGRRVLALDVRGRGRSDWDPEPHRYHPGVYAGDVIALLQHAGVSRAVFVGTSMGGLIMMTLAAMRPDLIAGAVLNDVGVRIAEGGMVRIVAAVSASHPHVPSWEEAAAFAKAANRLAFPDYGDADWMAFARRLFEPDGHGKLRQAYDPAIAEPIKAAVATGAPAPDLAPFFLGLVAGRPALLVHGALSDVLDRRTVEEMRLLAPAMDYAEVPGVGHAPMLTEAPALQAIARLLDRAG